MFLCWPHPRLSACPHCCRRWSPIPSPSRPWSYMPE
uniref:Uncharacterized protein n=1 Tax=Arundo donax TaxID=35708 RepID=A0A0A8Z3T8_ARUDO